jgi:hypothetical protein
MHYTPWGALLSAFKYMQGNQFGVTMCMPLPSSILDSIYHINRKEEAVNVISIMAVAVFWDGTSLHA